MEEIWKDIEGYEGLYQVSSFGRVRSMSRSVPRMKKNKVFQINLESKIRIPYIGATGYYFICLYKNHKQKNEKIHRLVAETFIPNPENKRVVNHIDGNKLNNRVDNLEWTTDGENVNHAYITGLSSSNIRLVCNETGEVFNSMSKAAQSLGVCAAYFHRKFHSNKPIRGKTFSIINDG